MRSLLKALASFVFGAFFVLQLSGCGGSTGGGGTTTPPPATVSSVAITGVPATLQAGSTAQAACTVTMSDSTTNHSCTFASSNTAVASIDAASGAITAKTAGTAGITATSTQDASKVSTASTLTVTTVPVTITSVSVTANPTAITTTQTSVCTATVTGTGAFSSAVTWTATGGTIVAGANGTATLTPAAVGTATCTATSAQAGYTTMSGSASVAVTQAVPTIKAVLPNVVYLDGQGEGYIEIDGTGFVSGESVNITAPGSLLSVSLVGTTKLQIVTKLESPYYSPGWFGLKVCEADGVTCSNTGYFAFIGNQNTLAIGPDGTLYQNDQAQGNATGANGYIRKFTVSNGTATLTGSLAFGLEASNPVDNKTGYNVSGISTSDANGNFISMAASDGNTGLWTGQDAIDGISCGARPNATPTANLVSCFQVGVKNAQLFDIALGTEPWTVAMGTFNSTTYAFVYSRKTTPMLWKVNAASATLVSSYAPTGFTDSATVKSTSQLGGWELVVFQNGSLSGTAALLSNYDKTLIFVNTTTMAQIGQPIVLTGNPFRIAKDETNGKVVVEFADFTNAATPKSTFASVSPTAITPAVYTSTSLNLGAGFAVSPDGNSLYICQRASCDVQPNK